jgi:hypothetical protein
MSAIEFNMSDSFGREGVLTAKLSGQFVQPPTKDNVVLYRGHVRTAANAQVGKVDEDYYIYVPLAGKEPRNYSLIIEDIAYMKGTQKITEDLSKNFTITEEYANFTVSPGVLVTKDDFKITIDNLLDETIPVFLVIKTLSGEEGGISSYSEDVEHEFQIKPGKEDLSFELDYLPGPTSKAFTFYYENLSYTVPISLYVDEQSEQSKTFAFDIQPTELDLTMPTFTNLTRLVYIYNTGTGTLTDVKVNADELKPFATLSEDRFSQILPNSNANLELRIVSASEQTISGKLEVRTDEGVYNEIQVSLRFKEGYEPSPEEVGPELKTDEKCESPEIKGVVCQKGEICDGESFYADNGLCCKGTCKKEPSGAAWKILGWGLLIALILGGVWFYFKKYKGVKKPVDLLKFAMKK